MKRNFTFVMLMLIPILAQTQDFTFSFGYASYSMTGLSNRQVMFKNLYYGKPKVIESFPGYYYYDLAVSFPIVQRFSLGAAFSSFSTGGRIHYADQTGEVRVDHLVTGQYLAVHPRFRILEKNGLVVSLYGKDGLVFSKLRYDEFYRVNDAITRRKENSTAVAGSLELGGMVHRRIIPHVHVHFSLGYHMNITPGEFPLDEHPNFYDSTVGCDWSGVRVAGGIRLDFRK